MMDNAMFYAIALGAVLFYLFYKYLTLNNDYWKERNIVYQTPRFFFSAISDFVLAEKTIGERYCDLYLKHPNERMIGVFKFGTPDLIVREPEDIKRVLIADFHNFQDRANFSNEKNEPLSVNLFSVRSDKWKVMRQKVTPAFTSGKLKNMFPLIVEVSEEFTKYLNNKISGSESEFQEVMAKFTTDVIGSCGFGINMNSMEDEDAPFRKMGRRAFEVKPWKIMSIMLKNIAPRTFSFFNMRTQDLQVEKFFKTVVRDICDEREKSGKIRHDFIDLMLELKHKEKEQEKNGSLETGKIKFDENFIAAQAFIFFLAGFETSSTLMSFTLHELAHNPDIQEKAHQEIRQVLKKHNGMLTYDSVSEMHYLDMVMSEAQRKYPALGVLFRICTSTYSFPETNFKIDPGTNISIPVYALHYDPKYYPDPEKFIPERFTQEAKMERHPMTYLPFGDGPRNCVGLRLGKMQSLVGLITVLKDFIVEPCSKTTSKMKFKPSSFVTSSVSGVWLKLKKRTENK